MTENPTDIQLETKAFRYALILSVPLGGIGLILFGAMGLGFRQTLISAGIGVVWSLGLFIMMWTVATDKVFTLQRIAIGFSSMAVPLFGIILYSVQTDRLSVVPMAIGVGAVMSGLYAVYLE